MLPPAYSDPSEDDEIQTWFAKGKWLQGWKIPPDSSIDRKVFASYYFRKPLPWIKAFTFLASTDLEAMDAGDYELDGDDVVLKVQQYITREENDTQYEAHRKYADIQYLVSGREKIGIAGLANTRATGPYDTLNDIIFLRASEDHYRVASGDSFFIFLPENPHRPCVNDGVARDVKKIVIKIRIV